MSSTDARIRPSARKRRKSTTCSDEAKQHYLTDSATTTKAENMEQQDKRLDTSSSLLADLPYVCLLNMLEYSTIKDFLQVRQTCQSLRNSFRNHQEVFRSIPISARDSFTCATMCRGEPQVLQYLMQNSTAASNCCKRVVLGAPARRDDCSRFCVRGGWLDKLLRGLIKNDDGPSITGLLQSGEGEHDGTFGHLLYPHGYLDLALEDYILYAEQCQQEQQVVTSSMAALRENELIMECTQFCELCSCKVGTTSCRWGDCHHGKCCSAYNDEIEEARRCHACEQQRDYCGVCCEFECQACRSDLQPHADEPDKCVWRECGDCGQRVCRLENDDKSCYKECSRCDTVKCEPCDDSKNGSVFRHYCHACYVQGNQGIFDGVFCDACRDEPCPVCQAELRLMHLYCTDEIRRSYELACRSVDCPCLYRS